MALAWGLVPHWSRDATAFINARSESAANKPAFRDAFHKRRCLIPADGFFEWQKRGTRKQPYYFQHRDGRPFAFAGLWERWQGTEGETVETCAILTTKANETVRPVHERMPVILPPEDFGHWLDPAVQKPEAVQALLRPYPAGEMESYPVSAFVNNARNEGPRCVEPAP